jgi:ElaB/YqjD/DUF883 family membrane-anchored ribosome-binding protein
MGDSSHQVTQHETETASGTGDRLQELEARIGNTVQAAESVAVQTVTTVKESVQAAAGSARQAAHSLAQTVDLDRQVQEHPWLVMGGSVALGFLAGQLLRECSHAASVAQATTGEQWGAQTKESAEQGAAGSGMSFGGLTTWLGQQLDEVKGFASSAVMNYAHALVARGLENLQEQLGQHGRGDGDRGSARSQTATEPRQGSLP